MNVFEIHHKSTAVIALELQDLSSSGDVDGEIIDTSQYEGLELMFTVTSVATATIPIVLYESDDSGMSGATQVSAAEQLGAPVLPIAGTLIARVGYIGKKRYVRARLESSTSVAPGAVGFGLLINPLHQPVAEQPAV